MSEAKEKLWTAAELLELGKQHLRIGQYPAAMQVASVVGDGAGANHAVLAMIGEAYAAQNELSNAQDFFVQALSQAAASGDFEAKIRYQMSVESISKQIADEHVKTDTLRKGIHDQAHENAFRVVRSVLRKYGFDDVLADLFDKVPAVENDLSWQTHETVALQQRAIERGVPAICINTVPKSGTMFLLNAFSEALEAPPIQVSVGLFPEDRVVPRWARLAAKGGCIAAQHMDGSGRNLKALGEAGLRKAWVHVRDPRQSILSFYHHVNSGDPNVAVDMDAAYYSLTAEEKISRHIKNGLRSNIRWLASWQQSIEADDSGIEILMTRHEDLAADPSSVFDKACAFYGIDRSLFEDELVSKREEGSWHFRKGETDEWRNVFSESHRAQIDEIMPEGTLEFFGWQR